MNKQKLKEKIIEIINNNYSEDNMFDINGIPIKKDFYFDIYACTDEIEKLFKEVE